MNTPPNNPNPPNAPDPLAVALAKLAPTPHGFEWNALMFAAGRASKARALVFWRIATGACALVACGFAFAYFTRPAVVTERIVYGERAPVHAEPALPAQPQLPGPVGGTPPGPVTNPNAKPDPKQEPPSGPARPSVSEPSGWTYDPPPVPGAAAKWFSTRNEVLTVGLSVLPDQGHKVSPPEGK